MTDTTDEQEPDMATTDFSPSDHTSAEVLDHLEGADPDEVQRVLEAEAVGRARVGILREHGGEAVEVTLLHHWTDADGDAHLPGDTVTVLAVVADLLVAGNYATRDKPEGTDAD